MAKFSQAAYQRAKFAANVHPKNNGNNIRVKSFQGFLWLSAQCLNIVDKGNKLADKGREELDKHLVFIEEGRPIFRGVDIFGSKWKGNR